MPFFSFLLSAREASSSCFLQVEQFTLYVECGLGNDQGFNNISISPQDNFHIPNAITQWEVYTCIFYFEDCGCMKVIFCGFYLENESSRTFPPIIISFLEPFFTPLQSLTPSFSFSNSIQNHIQALSHLLFLDPSFTPTQAPIHFVSCTSLVQSLIKLVSLSLSSYI